MSAWGSLGELTALPRPLAGFKEAASRQEGNGGEGREGLGGVGRGKGWERGNGWERRGKVPWLLGG